MAVALGGKVTKNVVQDSSKYTDKDAVDNRYIDAVYSEDRRPFTDYPYKLSNYLIEKFNIKIEDLLLDVGCGRGEMLSGFVAAGLCCSGVDQSDAASMNVVDVDLKVCDLENSPLPYADNHFDVVFSKSVIEHFYYPERIVQEMYRVLKPGGRLIAMTPDWDIMYRVFYEDCTHRSPFTGSSLHDIMKIHGFCDIQISKFRQLPILWGREKVMTPIAEATRQVTPRSWKARSKWVRFSKEVMLLGAARKPSS